jgi:hypothetical protein|tara:strand:- start:524 stop:1006 length:483 start_codon:yes stop_codon:yes gene_type:complete
MKKAIGIIVLSLLLYSCTTAREQLSKGGIKPGISKRQLVGFLGSTYPSEDAFMGGCFRKYYPSLRLEVLSSQSRSVYYIFENVYEASVPCHRSMVGDGRLATTKYNRQDVEEYVNLKVSKKTEKLKKEEEKKKEEKQLLKKKKEKDEEKTEKKEVDDDWF